MVEQRANHDINGLAFIVGIKCVKCKQSNDRNVVVNLESKDERDKHRSNENIIPDCSCKKTESNDDHKIEVDDCRSDAEPTEKNQNPSCKRPMCQFKR